MEKVTTKHDSFQDLGQKSSRNPPRQRSRSRSRHGSAAQRFQSRRDRFFSLDPSLADFDYNSYEHEIMEYKDQKNYDFKSIVARPPALQFEKVDRGGFYKTRSEIEVPTATDSSTSVKILKAAPHLDEHNNEVLSQSEEDMKEPKDQCRTLSCSEHEFSDYDHFDGDHEDDIRFWIDELSRLFKIDMEMVEKSNEFDSIEKLREFNDVCCLWIRSIYEQNQVLIDALDEIKETAQKDTSEFDELVRNLKQKLLLSHSERSQWKAKAEGLEYETTRNNEMIKKLNIDMTLLKEDKLEKDADSKRVQKDLEALKLLIIRLRDGGVWDLDGLDMSTETFTKVLGAGWKELCGMKLEGFDDLKRDKLELKEELASMRHEREHLRAKLFSKERNLHKLKGEEQAVKARLAFSKAEEGALINRIADLKSEERALREMGEADTLDDFFVKL